MFLLELENSFIFLKGYANASLRQNLQADYTAPINTPFLCWRKVADLLKTSNAALIFLFQQKSNKVGQQLLMACLSALFLANETKAFLSLLRKRKCRKLGRESIVFLLFIFIISFQIRKTSFDCLAVIILNLFITSLFNLPQKRAQKPLTAKKRTQTYRCSLVLDTLLFYKRALRLAAIFYRIILSTTSSKTLLLLSKREGLIQPATGSISAGWVVFLLRILARGDRVDFSPFYPYGESADPNPKLMLFFLMKLGLRDVSSGSVLILLLLALVLRKGSEIFEERRESCLYS